MRKLLMALWVAGPLTVLAASPQTVTLVVQNMTCELCPITVTVTHDADLAPSEALTKATTNAGYLSTVQK